jgi:hypothetical protein
MQGSHHSFDGKVQLGEIHFVHHSDEYDSIEDAIKSGDSDAIAVCFYSYYIYDALAGPCVFSSPVLGLRDTLPSSAKLAAEIMCAHPILANRRQVVSVMLQKGDGEEPAAYVDLLEVIGGESDAELNLDALLPASLAQSVPTSRAFITADAADALPALRTKEQTESSVTRYVWKFQ